MIRLATSPDPHTVNATRSVLTMFKRNSMTDPTHRSIPGPRPNPEPNPEPDAELAARFPNISPADWDRLFDAVTERLQASAAPAPLEAVAQHPLGMTATLEETVSECVESLNRLHTMLTRERQQRRQL